MLLQEWKGFNCLHCYISLTVSLSAVLSFPFNLSHLMLCLYFYVPIFLCICLSLSCLCLSLSFMVYQSHSFSLSLLQGPGSQELSGRREECGEDQWFWHVTRRTGRRVFSDRRNETNPSKMDCTRGSQLWYSHIQLRLFHTLNTVKQERDTTSHLSSLLTVYIVLNVFL